MLSHSTTGTQTIRPESTYISFAGLGRGICEGLDVSVSAWHTDKDHCYSSMICSGVQPPVHGHFLVYLSFLFLDILVRVQYSLNVLVVRVTDFLPSLEELEHAVLQSLSNTVPSQRKYCLFFSVFTQLFAAQTIELCTLGIQQTRKLSDPDRTFTVMPRSAKIPR